jgi:hypothetical protein
MFWQCGCKELYILEYNGEGFVENQPTFQRNVSPPYLGSKIRTRNQQDLFATMLHSDSFLDLLFGLKISRYIPPKRRLTFSGLYGVTSQNVWVFIVMKLLVPSEVGIFLSSWAIICFFMDSAACKMWGFHSGDYEECRLLGCGAVWVTSVLIRPTRRHIPADRSLHSSMKLVVVFTYKLSLCCWAQPVSAVWGHNPCSFWETYETHQYILWEE